MHSGDNMKERQDSHGGQIKASSRRGRLKNGAEPGDVTGAPRCGARTRNGTPCRNPRVRSATGDPVYRSRCRMHGGLSTGPRTVAGKRRIISARLKHGRYSGVERIVRRWVNEQRQVYAARAATRDPVMRKLWAGLAFGPVDQAYVDDLRNIVLTAGVNAFSE